MEANLPEKFREMQLQLNDHDDRLRKNTWDITMGADTQSTYKRSADKTSQMLDDIKDMFDRMDHSCIERQQSLID